MKLTCTGCQHQIVLDDAKLPQGVFKVKCPRCGKIVTGQKESSAGQASSASSGSSAADELQAAYGAQSAATAGVPAHIESGTGNGVTASEVQALVRKEVARMKQEIQGSMATLLGGGRGFRTESYSDPEEEAEGLEKALVCEDDPAFVEIISASLKRLGYRVETASTTAEALKKVESGSYDLISVDYVFPDDKEGGARIMARINGLKPALRRETFVVLVSANVKSADASAAFFHGANITVNKEEIRHLEHLIREGRRRFHDLYRVFNRILQEKNEKI